MLGSLRGCGGRTRCCPTIRAGIVSTPCVQLELGAVEATPDDHFGVGPDRGVVITTSGCVGGARSRPRIRGRVVSATCVKILAVVDVSSNPDNHLRSGPNCTVGVSASGNSTVTRCHPTVGAWIVSATGVKSCHVIGSAPDDHFAVRPHCGGTVSPRRRIDGASSSPAISDGVISAPRY
jgi:hypothetical protein